MRFKDRLQQLRQEQGLTQVALAIRADLPLPTLRCYEQGHRMPSWVTVARLCKALGVSADVFTDCDEATIDKPRNKAARKRRRK